MGLNKEIDSLKAKLFEIDEWLTRHRECPDDWPFANIINARRDQEAVKLTLIKQLENLINKLP